MKDTLRRCILIIMAAAFFLTGCEGEKPESYREAEKQSPVKEEIEGVIVALGDSLTAGLGVEIESAYPALLQTKLKQDGYNYRVVNAGVSGETSSGTLSRLNWILSQNPDIVILEIGANDGLRGIETDLIEKNIGEILVRLQKKDITVILAGMQMVWNLGVKYTTEFNSLYPKLAEQHGVIFMPFFLENVAAVTELNQSDGIHPNEKGYVTIVDTIYPFVIKAINNHRRKIR